MPHEPREESVTGDGGEPSFQPAREGQPGHGRGANGPLEIGGRAGPEPTRFGDWEKDGRCIDF